MRRAKLPWWSISILFILLVLISYGCGSGSVPGGWTGRDASSDQQDTTQDQNDVDSTEVQQNQECNIDLDCQSDKECMVGQCVDGKCKYKILGGYCLINNKCYKPQQVNPDNPCEECIPSVSQDSWTPDDTNTYKESNGCYVYKCVNGKGVKTPQIDCDDHNPCTDDSCNEDTGKCVHEPLSDVACDDGNVCTLNDTCVDGKCVSGKDRMDCDDGNPCTEDTCDPKKGCINKVLANGTACGSEEEEKQCKIKHICQDGKCILKKNNGGIGPSDEKLCDDHNPCTDDYCVVGVGCVHKDNNKLCDDGDPCTVGDHCMATVCVPGSELLNCDDGNPCTSDYCEKGVGCKHIKLTSSMQTRASGPTPMSSVGGYYPCDDHNACTSHSVCYKGECVPQVVINCNDGNPCTIDSCDPLTGCHYVYAAPGTVCDDHNKCTIKSVCKAGHCVPVTHTNCDDHNNCTLDSCDPQKGCVHTYQLDKTGCNQLKLEFTPKRGLTLSPANLKNGKVEIKGSLTVPKGTNPTLTINGHNVRWTSVPGGGGGGGQSNRPTSSNTDKWGFVYYMTPKLGMNIIDANVVVKYQGNEIASTDELRSFY